MNNLFSPPQASLYEPRLGITKIFGAAELRVDIGNAIEVLQWRPNPDIAQTFVFAGEFYAYGLIQNNGPFILQADAIDAFFGGYFAYRDETTALGILTARLLVGHASAHLVDGRFDIANGWRDGRLPTGFSREYAQLLAMIEQSFFRIYGAVQYTFRARPDGANVGLQLGGEVMHKVYQDATLYAAYDFRLARTGAVQGSNTVQAGVKFGRYTGRGINLYIAAFEGTNPYGQFFFERIAFSGIGFKLDF